MVEVHFYLPTPPRVLFSVNPPSPSIARWVYSRIVPWSLLRSVLLYNGTNAATIDLSRTFKDHLHLGYLVSLFPLRGDLACS